MKLTQVGGRWVARYRGKTICAAIAPAGADAKQRLADKSGGGFRYLFTLGDR
jgi:hypothetical protein